MSLLSKIEWTDATWNPIRGCAKVSPGCKRCYAERFAERFRGVKGHPFEYGFDLRLVPKKLGDPSLEPTKDDLRQLNERSLSGWRTARIHFEGSCYDASRALAYLSSAHETLERLRELLCGPLREAATEAHIWWDVSVEDRKYGLPRIADLQATPAAVRFLSVEPLLEDIGILPLEGISWVIVGGESGPGARPMNEAWVLSIKEQCEAANVPFFFKQWGGVRKKAAGRKLHGRTYDGFPKRLQNATLPIGLRLQHAVEIENVSLTRIG